MITKYENVSLEKYAFYGVGGVADEIWKINNKNEAKDAWQETIGTNKPYCVLGKGANIVFADEGLRGRVLIPNWQNLEINKENTETLLLADAGAGLDQAIGITAKAGWSDLCSLSGIPGTIGGSVRGNAGAYGAEMRDFVVSIDYLNERGELQTMTGSEAQFDYRESIFKKNPQWLIIQATLRLSKPDDPSKALQKAKKLHQERWAKYPPGRSGGCIFKNPEPKNSIYAGQMLDQLGAKGDSQGKVQISDKHANFFVNLGGATQKDLLILMRRWQKKVQEKYTYNLEPEIMLVDVYGQKIEL